MESRGSHAPRGVPVQQHERTPAGTHARIAASKHSRTPAGQLNVYLVASRCPMIATEEFILPSLSSTVAHVFSLDNQSMPIRVFVSYTHDSDEHRRAVLDLATRLRQDGVDVRLDRWVEGTPEQGWPAWMEDEIRRADFIVVVCSSLYYERYRGDGNPEQGRGGRWESNLIRDTLYANRSSLRRFVPVLADGADETSVPDPLRQSVTRYRLGAEYDDLFRYLTSQPARRMPPIGPLRYMPTEGFDGSEDCPSNEDHRAERRPSTTWVIGQLPSEPQSFIERTFVQRVAAELDTSQVVVVTALTGMRGVGKTQVAAACARAAVQRGIPLVAWVNADSPKNLVAGLARVAERLSLVPADNDPQDSARALREHLSSWGQEALIVLDNARDPRLIYGFLPSTGRSKIIITTTDRSFDELAIAIDVSIYERAESIEYLCRRTLSDDTPGANDIAEELGDLPLALASIAAYIRRYRRSYGRCLEDLHAYPVAEVLGRGRGIGYPQTTAAALLMAVESVGIDDDGGIAELLLEIIATLSSDGVRRDLLSRVATGARGGWSDTDVQDALERCVSASVLSWSEAGDAVIMHRLMARVIRERTDHAGRWDDAISGALELLEGELNADYDWSGRDTSLHVVEQIQALADTFFPEEGDESGRQGDSEE